MQALHGELAGLPLRDAPTDQPSGEIVAERQQVSDVRP
jgi:hypothetical protein